MDISAEDDAREAFENMNPCNISSALFLAEADKIDGGVLPISMEIIWNHYRDTDGAESGSNVEKNIYVACDTPTSTNDPSYHADFCRISLWTDGHRTKIVETDTGINGGEITVPSEYRNQRLILEARACANSGRVLSGKSQCSSQPATEQIYQQGRGANLTSDPISIINSKIEKANINMAINSEKRGRACDLTYHAAKKLFSKFARETGITHDHNLLYQKIISRTDISKRDKQTLAFANFVYVKPHIFRAYCTTEELDDVYEMVQSVNLNPQFENLTVEELKNSTDSSGSGLFLTAGGSGDGDCGDTNSYVSEPSQEELDCDARVAEGYTWDSINLECTPPSNSAQFYAGGNTDSNTTGGNTDSNSTGGNTDTNGTGGANDSAAPGTGAAPNTQVASGTPPPTSTLPVIAQASGMDLVFSLIPESNDTLCLGNGEQDGASGGNVKFTTCKASDDSSAIRQQFKFDEVGGSGTFLLANGTQCLKVNYDDNSPAPYPVKFDNADCSTTTASEPHNFWLDKTTYNQSTYYAVKVYPDAAAKSSQKPLCLQLGDGGNDAENLYAAECTSASEWALKTKQVFSVIMNGGPKPLPLPPSGPGLYSKAQSWSDNKGENCLAFATASGSPLTIQGCTDSTMKDRISIQWEDTQASPYVVVKSKPGSDGKQMCADYSDGSLKGITCDPTFQGQKFQLRSWQRTAGGTGTYYYLQTQARNPECIVAAGPGPGSGVSLGSCSSGDFNAMNMQLFTLDEMGDVQLAQDSCAGKNWWQCREKQLVRGIVGSVLMIGGLVGLAYSINKLVTTNVETNKTTRANDRFKKNNVVAAAGTDAFRSQMNKMHAADLAVLRAKTAKYGSFHLEYKGDKVSERVVPGEKFSGGYTVGTDVKNIAARAPGSKVATLYKPGETIPKGATLVGQTDASGTRMTKGFELRSTYELESTRLVDTSSPNSPKKYPFNPQKGNVTIDLPDGTKATFRGQDSLAKNMKNRKGLKNAAGVAGVVISVAAVVIGGFVADGAAEKPDSRGASGDQPGSGLFLAGGEENDNCANNTNRFNEFICNVQLSEMYYGELRTEFEEFKQQRLDALIELENLEE